MSTHSLFSSLRHPRVSRLFDDSHSIWSILDGTDSFLSDLTRPVTESSDAYSTEIVLPGVKRDEVTVEAHEGYVSISAASKRFSTKVERTVVFPGEADLSTVAAKLEDGILTLTVKKVAKAQPRKVTIS
jgi:HSP20 family molecular chaperone IbpA